MKLFPFEYFLAKKIIEAGDYLFGVLMVDLCYLFGNDDSFSRTDYTHHNTEKMVQLEFGLSGPQHKSS